MTAMPAINFEEERIRGNTFFKEKNYERAIETYNNATILAETLLEQLKCKGSTIEIITKNLIDLSLLYFNLSVTYSKMWNYQLALTFIKKATDLSKDERYLARMGIIYFKIGNYQEGINIYESLADKNISPELKNYVGAIKSVGMEECYNVMGFPQDLTFSVDLDGDEIIYNEEFLKNITNEFKEGRVLPSKIICGILKKAYAIFSNLDNLIYIDTDDEIVVFGDTHGSYFDTLMMINKIDIHRPVKLVFNGDFVDRGKFSVENFIFLALLKIIYPEKIFLNRGNHEFQEMNTTMGFFAEIQQKYRFSYDVIYMFFSLVFSVLPIATVLNRKVFVTHGGLPAEGLGVSDIQSINRKIRNNLSDQRYIGLIWSDPAEIDEVLPNKRGVGVLFGRYVTQRFLQKNNFNLIVRSHEFCTTGFKSNHNGNVITIFSAPNYIQSANPCACLVFRKTLDEKQVDYDILYFNEHEDREVFK